MPNDEKIFGERMKKKRQELCLSQIEAAERLGISPNHLSSIENGKSHPSHKLILRICDEYDTDANYLFLGALHSNNLSKNIIDKVRLLSDWKLALLDNFLDFLFTLNEQN